MKKIAVLGSGKVGEVLADGFLGRGHAVMRGSREPQKLAAWQTSAKGEASIGSFADAAKWAELVVLAVKGTAAEAAIELAGVQHLDGKTVIDATNPIADAPPQHGVLQFFTAQNESLMERLQRKAPQAHFVKAFNSVGSALMVDPKLPATPTMFICGDDAGAKQETTEILTKFGWETCDMGSVEAARPIESLCMLWCIPGMLHNHWMHAFKYLKLT